MLDKRLQLGGLQVGGPRTTQNSARFRIADNVYQTLDEYMIYRFGNKDYLTGFASDEIVIAITNYRLKPFIITRTGDNKLHFYYDDIVRLPCPSNMAFVINPDPDDLLSMGIQFVEAQGCLFFNMPVLGLHKFDGIQVYRAGVPTPWVYCAQYADAGATWVRIIGHHLDFQGNVVNSGYVQFPVTPSGTNITIQTDQNSVRDMVGSYFGFSYSKVSPKGRQEYDSLYNGHDTFYMVAASAVYAADSVTYTTGGNHNVAVGCYLFMNTSFAAPFSSAFNEESLAQAFKVSAVTATTVTLTTADAKYLDTNRKWHTETSTNNIPGAGSYSNHWLSIWTSNVETGNYVWKQNIPAPFFSTTAQTSTINVSSPTTATVDADKNAFNLAGNMGDIYDVTTVKLPFPCYLDDLPSLSFCTYGDLALISQVNEIYFSDTSLGGAFEMVNGNSFIAVGGGNDGPVQAVQGTTDFFLVSRQFKNYYVTGNLPTANYRVQPISQTSVGALTNEATISCLDKVLFVNKVGVWVLYSGGRCEEVSYNARGLFTNFSNSRVYPEESYFGLENYPTYITPTQFVEDSEGAWNKWVKLRYDICRNLVTILIDENDGKGQMLVLNMNNGELYTWNDLMYGLDSPKFKDLCFINGEYYITGNSDSGHTIRKEEKEDSEKNNYMNGTFPPTLATTWFTAGEPSLEKKTKQIKIWGTIVGDVNFSQYVDWRSTPSDEGTYVSSDPELFSHKRRLQAQNALSLSVKMVFLAPTVEIEGLELEFEAFQMGMKR